MKKSVKMFVIALVSLVFLGLISLYPILYLTALNNVAIENAIISKLGFGQEGLTLEGTLEFSNPGLVDVMLDKIEYQFILNNTKEQLGSGEIQGIFIPAKGNAELPFKKVIEWKPGIDDAVELLKAKKVILTIQGTVSAKFLGKIFTSPFVMHLDVKAHLQHYVQQQMEELGQGLQQGLEGLRGLLG
ncbi:LEA type 2 family protein [Candidatus Woesearchaeota archaeon]|nr:LEA type 2 family protein [Candidatus Woesearchaeota archaeon]